MIKIRIANKKEFPGILKVAGDLRKWFTAEALRNMKKDLEINRTIVASEKNKILGFICYNSYNGAIKILWMGISKPMHRIGIGNKMLTWMINFCKKNEFTFLETETLPEEEKYIPYEQTRNFYYKNGFRRTEYRKARIKGWNDQILLVKEIS